VTGRLQHKFSQRVPNQRETTNVGKMEAKATRLLPNQRETAKVGKMEAKATRLLPNQRETAKVGKIEAKATRLQLSTAPPSANIKTRSTTSAVRHSCLRTGLSEQRVSRDYSA